MAGSEDCEDGSDETGEDGSKGHFSSDFFEAQAIK